MMRDDETGKATELAPTNSVSVRSIPAGAVPPKSTSAFARLNERAKVLNDVKINFVTVVIFIACLGVLTFVATGLGWITHHGLKSMERAGRT